MIGDSALLDDFNRANANPIGGNWTTINGVADEHMEILSNQLKAGGTFGCWSAWNPTTFAADQEVWFPVPALSTTDGHDVQLMTRLQSIGTTGVDGYWGHVVRDAAAWSLWEIYRLDNNGLTLLGASVVGPTFAAGDDILMRSIGQTHSLWRRPAAGAWTLVMSRDDPTYAVAGNIGVGAFGEAVRLDDVRGGAVVTSMVTAKVPVPFIYIGATS